MNIVSTIIKSHNIIALEQFMTIFNITTIQMKEILIELFKEKGFGFSGFREFKMFNYLQHKYQVPNGDKYGIGTFEEAAFKIFNYDNGSKFKKLIKLCKQIKSNPQFNKLGNILELRDSFQVLELVEKQFTTDQLNSTTKQLLLELTQYSSDPNVAFKNIQLKESIRMVLKVVLHLFEDYNINCLSIKGLYLNQINYQHLCLKERYKYFKYFINQLETSQDKLNYISSTVKEISTIYEYEEDYYDDDGDDDRSEGIELINILLKEILSTQDIEIIDHFIKASNYFEIYYVYPTPLFSNIESIKILDFLFNNQQYQNILYADKNQYWQWFDNLQLLEYYEGQMKSLNRKILVGSMFRSDCSVLLVQHLLRATQLPDTYQISNEMSYSSFSNIIQYGINNGHQDMVLSIFKSGILKSIYLYSDGYNFGYHPAPSIVNWILNNCNQLPVIKTIYQELIIKIKNSDTSIRTTPKILYKLLIRCGKLQESIKLFNNNQLDIQLRLFESLEVKTNHIVLIELVLYYYSRFNNNNQLQIIEKKLKDILESICISGDIESLKYLVLHHPILLGINSGSSSNYNNNNNNNNNIIKNRLASTLSVKESMTLLSSLINNSHIEMIQIYLNFIIINDLVYENIRQVTRSSLGLKYFKKIINK